jgi:alkyl hydroperoxide reductase subunit AhpF
MFSKFLKFGGTLGVITFGGYGYYQYTLQEKRFHTVNAEQPKIHGSIPTRSQQVEKLQSNTEFDLLVIGGGATGTGIALVCVQ